MLQPAGSRPPLDIAALFNDEIPASLSWTIDGAPPFDARRLDPPFAPFVGHLADPSQPLTVEERRTAENARVGLALRCTAEVPATERLDAAIELMCRCYENGAAAIVLPAAQKIIGPSAMMALLPELDGMGGWLKLFLELCTFHDEQDAWAHTHGMEHFGLPDLECRTALAEVSLGEGLILECIRHLMEHGGSALNVGDFFEAEASGSRPLSRFWVYPPRGVVGHEYGAYGALQLVPDPRPYAPAGTSPSAQDPCAMTES